MTKKNLYRLHRILSIIIGIPIFLWAISGLMHPLMTSVRPAIKTQASPNKVSELKASVMQNAEPLKKVLENAGIRQCFRVHLIHMDTTWYYQVITSPGAVAQYFNLQNGEELENGHQRYAGQLARYFLEGAAPYAPTPIVSIQRITDYTNQYSYVNRLLPVDKVSFDRPDRISIYVDTNNGRFAFALDQDRGAFNQFFSWFHTWSWMDNLPKLKAAIIALILLMTLFTAGLGIYLAFTTKSRRQKQKPNLHPLVKARRLHRLTALTGAVFLLAWAFSGLVHAIQNARPPFKIQPVSKERIQTAALPDALPQNLAALANTSFIASLRLLQVNGQLWVATEACARNPAVKDLMLDQGVNDDLSQSHFYLWDQSQNGLVPYTERQMAAVMATAAYGLDIDTGRSSGSGSGINKSAGGLGQKSRQIDPAKLLYLTRFTEQYNFSDKILPVWQVNNGPDLSDRIFLDVSTGSVVKKGDAFKQADALIFAFFHKHEFMAWAGKSAKDASTIIGVLIVIMVLTVGYRLVYVKYRHRQSNRPSKDLKK